LASIKRSSKVGKRFKMPTKDEVLDAIRECGQALGRAPSRAEFKSRTGIGQYQVDLHFASWRAAVVAAGLTPDTSTVRLEDDALLAGWGNLVRRLRHIPTRAVYRPEGKYSPGVFERHFGPWSTAPERFRAFATGKAEWGDVLALLPVDTKPPHPSAPQSAVATTPTAPSPRPTPDVGLQHTEMDDRPTYGNPIDFRGLRHEPVNEDGVVFLFGMVARELGYLVEAVQAGFPDCEAKRQVGPGKWQRVRIEFEFESRNFRDHGHPPDGCDLIVCWRHNWAECPSHLEVVEISKVIQTLSASDE
jgi:hypothetical protein